MGPNQNPTQPLPNLQVPSPQPQQSVTPPPPPKKSKLWIILIALAAVVLLGIAGVFAYLKMVKNTNQKSYQIIQATPSPTQLSLDKKIIYGVLDNGNLNVYESDYSGNSQNIWEEASVSAVFRVSPDNTILPFVSEKKPGTLSVENLVNKTVKDYTLEASSSGVRDVSWGNSGNELLFVTQSSSGQENGGLTVLSSAQTKLEKLSLVGGQIEDLGVVASKAESSPGTGTFPAVVKFLRMDNSGQTFLSVGELCAPGPCFDKIMSYDWQTGLLKDNLDFSGLSTDIGQFADVNPDGKEALFENGAMDGYLPANLVLGILNQYSFDDKKVNPVLNTKGVSYTNAQYIDQNEILYNQVSPPNGASSNGNPSSQWYILDLQTKQQNKVFYSGYDLVPFNQDLGLINLNSQDGNELDVLDFKSGRTTKLFKSLSGQIFILN